MPTAVKGKTKPKAGEKGKEDNGTHIHVLLDRTGSMEVIRDDTIGGFNAFVRTQKEAPGRATMTLAQFDTVDPYEIVFGFKDIQDVPDLTREAYVPRACTPLLDAMGRGINDLEKTLSGIDGKKKPSKVVFVVITDGQENSSREFNKSQIENMLKQKQGKAKWEFVFLGASMAGIGDAVALGIPAFNAMGFDKTPKGVAAAFRCTSRNLISYRTGDSVTPAFTAEDRSHQNIEKEE
jgi:hypothetical protein